MKRIRLSFTRFCWLVLMVGVLAYCLYFSALAIRRHDALQTNTADLGQIDNAIWNTYQGRFVEEIKGDTFSTRITDHLEPIFWPVSLLFGIWNDARVLLVLQVISLGLAAIPIFAYVRYVSANQPNQHFALLIALWAAFVYLLAPQAQAAFVAEFHAAPLAALPLVMLLYFGTRHRTVPAIAMALLACSVKEEISLMVLAICLYLAASKHWRPGWLLASLALAWFALATFVIIPHYSLAAYGKEQSPYLARYDDTQSSATGLVSRLSGLFTGKRLNYLLGLLFAFAGMPLLAPELVFTAAPLIAANYTSNYAAMYSGELHYSAPFMALLACAAGVGGYRLLRFLGAHGKILVYITVPIIVALPPIYQVWEGYTPLGREYRSSWPPITAHTQTLARFAPQIPDDASLSVTTALYPHFSHRREVYTFPVVNDADYVLIDAAGTTDMHPADLKWSVNSLLADNYGIVDGADGFLLMSRSSGEKTIPDQFYTFARTQIGAENNLQADFGTSMRLVGYQWLDNPKRQLTSLRLYWQVLSPLSEDYHLYIAFFDSWGQKIADTNAVPFLETPWYPINTWQRGESVVTTTVAMPLGNSFGAYITFYSGADSGDVAARLPVTSANSDLASQSVHLLRLPPVMRQSNAPNSSLEPIVYNLTSNIYMFKNSIELLSATPQTQSLNAGDSVKVNMLWRRQSDVSVELAKSLRLISADGKTVAQADGPFLEGFYPPHDWSIAIAVGDTSNLPVPVNTPSGEYRLDLILYDRNTLTPIPLSDGSTALSLGSIRIN